MSRDSMIRGAREANEESHRAAQSRAMGEALGSMAAFIVAINKLTERMETVEAAPQAMRLLRCARLPDAGRIRIQGQVHRHRLHRRDADQDAPPSSRRNLEPARLSRQGAASG